MNHVESMDEQATSEADEAKGVTIETFPANEEPCADQPLEARIEALLLSSDRPMNESRLAELLGIAAKGATKRLREAFDSLNAAYEQAGRAFRAERLAGGWQLLTLPAFGPLLNRLHTDRQTSRLSQAALETLAIISYRQPIMRAEIEAIRGVASGEVLRGLLERRLVKIAGRAEELGRPMLYGTTKEFLKVFGLANLDDLPAVQGLSPVAPPSTGSPPSPQSAGPGAAPSAKRAEVDEPEHDGPAEQPESDRD